MKKKIELPAITLERVLAILGYILLLAFYFISEKCSRMTSTSKEMYTVFNHLLPVASLAGVFSSISTLVLISLVVFYRKIGFYSSIVILAYRIFNLTKGILRFHPTGLPALFITLIGLVSILLIYQRNERIIRVQERHRKELVDFTNSIIDAFAVCIDGKDSYTNGHSLRVAQYTRMLAKKLGEDEETIQKFYNIALLHDIGKIGIPDDILNKPGKLTEEEYEIVKTHPYRGYEILKKVKTQKDLVEGAQFHHERFDGRGYPARLAGEKIPLVARIISVADAFDAMSSTRPYRKKMPMDVIVQEIKDCTGSQFDPKISKAFLELYEEGAFDNLKTE
ncbi:MAG: HD domain-containing protein [Treponema sp.]|nr:HD domain-containing protein [Treponema sp.]